MAERGREGDKSVPDLANRGQYHSVAGSQRGGGDEVRIAQDRGRGGDGWKLDRGTAGGKDRQGGGESGVRRGRDTVEHGMGKTGEDERGEEETDKGCRRRGVHYSASMGTQTAAYHLPFQNKLLLFRRVFAYVCP